MGKVYAATVAGRCPGLAPGTAVALKVVHPHLLETAGFFKRFMREAEIGKSVVHENVVRTFDADAIATGGVQHNLLVMEYVEGQTLRDLLRELERVPEELCRHVGREVAKGLAAIHAAGVVHRDVKPENVLITKEHVVKVMDLGVARLNDEALRLSQTGAFVGSIHYAAPECFSEGGRHADGRADLHALGLVLYELAGGVNPYLAESLPEILKRVLHEEPRRLGDVNPQLSPYFEEVVHTLLAKDPEDRFADAATLLGVLEEGEASAWWKSRAKVIRAETHRPLRRIRIPRETAVYGRDAEIGKLRGLYEMARAGDGRVVVVEGEAGIGKSRVVDEVIGQLQRDGEDLNFLFGSYPPGGAATAAGAFSTAFREQFGDSDLAETFRTRLGPAAALAPAFASLLVGTAAPTGAEQLTRDSLQACFVEALRSLAADRTTVLLIDDLHFASEDARSLFTALAMSVPGHRILLVGTTRPGIDEKWVAGLTRLPHVTQIPLNRLGPKDLGALLRDSFRSEQLAQSLALQVGIKSDGNPFFAFEIIRGLREGQFITQQGDGTWVSTRVIADIQIPSSVLDLVNARVADLTEDERNLLDVAACCGFEFDPLLVGAVLGVPQIPLMRALGQIEKKHRLVRASGRRYVFDHHQVQEALYGAMSELLREPYHAALAEALESRAKAAERDPATLDGALCVDLCEHFLKGAQGERALRYVDAALTHLTAGCLHDAAVRLARRALDVPGLVTGSARAELLLRLGEELGPLGLLGRVEPQIAALDEALALAGAATAPRLRARIQMTRGFALVMNQRLESAREALRESIDLARAVGDHETEAFSTGNMGHLLGRTGRHEEALAHHERQEALGREHGFRRVEGNAIGNAGNALMALGRFEEAQERYERAIAFCRGNGLRAAEAGGLTNLGNALGVQGRLAEARAWHEQGLAIAREIGHRDFESIAWICLSQDCVAAGRLAEAVGHAERHLAICRQLGRRHQEAAGLAHLGDVLAEAGDAGAARERHLAALAIREEFGDPVGVAWSHLALGALARETADERETRSRLGKALDGAAESGVAEVEVLARCHLACLPGGDASSAEASLAAHDGRMQSAVRRDARWLLWQATGNRAHLAEAKRLLDESLGRVDAETRQSILANRRLSRSIAAAASEHGL